MIDIFELKMEVAFLDRLSARRSSETMEFGTLAVGEGMNHPSSSHPMHELQHPF
jgi:hypothetical protein